jgi:hypothetical protein
MRTEEHHFHLPAHLFQLIVHPAMNGSELVNIEKTPGKARFVGGHCNPETGTVQGGNGFHAAR